MPMKPSLLALALLFAAAPVAAHTNIRGHQCDIGSDWNVNMHRRAFVFSREGHDPAEIGIGGGRLFVDGKEMKLSEADHQRISQIERQMTESLPVLHDIVVEAVDIAFSALTEVARGLASDPKATVADLQRAQVRVRGEMQDKPLAAFDGDAIGKVVEPVVAQFVPDIIGGAVSSALGAAFGGEQKANDFEQRMTRMEQQINRNVDKRAEALEPKADELCSRLKSIDAIDDSLEFRLPDGEPLDLLRVGPRDKD